MSIINWSTVNIRKPLKNIHKKLDNCQTKRRQGRHLSNFLWLFFWEASLNALLGLFKYEEDSLFIKTFTNNKKVVDTVYPPKKNQGTFW